MIYDTLRIYSPTASIPYRDERQEVILQVCAGKRVLHVGCTDAPVTQTRLEEGTLLHLALMNCCRDLVGIDISDEGLSLLRANGITNVHHVDAERFLPETFDGPFDVVLAGDVLEHLSNPGLFLANAREVLTATGVLLVGVPSALTLNNLKVWARRGEVVHKDHCFYFSPKTLATLCGRYGLLPTSLCFTVQPLTSGESRFFGLFRRALLRHSKTMAPSFVMAFQKQEAVDRSSYIEWK